MPATRPGDTRDGPADVPAADVVTGGATRPMGVSTRSVARIGWPMRSPMRSSTASTRRDVAGDAGDAPVETDATSDAIMDGAPSDAPVEAGRPYIERDCSQGGRLRLCVERELPVHLPRRRLRRHVYRGQRLHSDLFGSLRVLSQLRQRRECVLACFLGVCAHFFGPASTLACDSAGTGCI